MAQVESGQVGVDKEVFRKKFEVVVGKIRHVRLLRDRLVALSAPFHEVRLILKRPVTRQFDIKVRKSAKQTNQVTVFLSSTCRWSWRSARATLHRRVRGWPWRWWCSRLLSGRIRGGVVLVTPPLSRGLSTALPLADSCRCLRKKFFSSCKIEKKIKKMKEVKKI